MLHKRARIVASEYTKSISDARFWTKWEFENNQSKSFVLLEIGSEEEAKNAVKKVWILVRRERRGNEEVGSFAFCSTCKEVHYLILWRNYWDVLVSGEVMTMTQIMH